MLISQNLVSVFHFVLKVHNSITTILYSKPTTDPRIALDNVSLSLKSVQKFYIGYKISVAYTLALCYQIVHAVMFGGKNENVSLVVLVPSLLFLISFVFHLPTLREHYRKREEFSPLFNAFLNFERQHNGLSPCLFKLYHLP